jgi:hypothetical protein
MKGSRSIIGAAVAIGLLAGSAVGVTAQEEDAPATVPVEPVTFTASLRPGDDVGSTTLTEVDGRIERRGTVWAPTLTVSDPRLEGDVRLASPEDQYPGGFTIRTNTWRIENAEGAWQGTMVDVGGGGTLILEGEGAFEGLYAALDVTNPSDMRGVIFPAPPPPPVPEAP